MIAIDTNILIYAIDDSEPVKQSKAQALLSILSANPASTVTLWQVLSELLRYLRRLVEVGDISEQQMRAEFDVYRNLFAVQAPSPGVFDRALDLASRYSLSHWDSMLLGACEVAGVTELHTKDMGSPRSIGSVQLLNPLV